MIVVGMALAVAYCVEAASSAFIGLWVDNAPGGLTLVEAAGRPSEARFARILLIRPQLNSGVMRATGVVR